jgi:hypothetical protein
MEQENTINEFLNKYENILNFYDEYDKDELNKFFLNLIKYKIDHDDYINDINYINYFIKEIEKIFSQFIQEDIIKTTKTGYYNLNDNKKISGYSGSTRTDKYIINYMIDNELININRIESILNKYYNIKIKLIKGGCYFNTNIDYDKKPTFKEFYYMMKDVFNDNKMIILVKNFYKEIINN